MMEKEVIIIGAGLAGLSAGIHARINGFKPRIFEHHKLPGGVIASWKRSGYTFDGGIHYLMGHKPESNLYEQYRIMGILPAVKCLDMTTYARYIDTASGSELTFPAEIDRWEQMLKELSPDDAHIVDMIAGCARGLRDFNFASMQGKPADLTSAFDRISAMWQMRGVLKYMSGVYIKSVRENTKNVKDPFLRYVIDHLFADEMPVCLLCLILATVSNGQCGIPLGGSPAVVDAVVKRCLELGVEINYGATVEKVIVENDKAVGVKLKDGTEYRGSYVVSTADGRSTIFDMLDGRYVDGSIRKRYDNWKLFKPLVVVCLGVNAPLKDSPWLSIYKMTEPIAFGSQSTDSLAVRMFPYSDAFAPAGKSAVVTYLESDWDYWYELRKNPAAYTAEKERIASEVIRRLETYVPAIKGKVETVDTATPYTYWRYTRNHRGAFEGFMMTPESSMKMLKNMLPGLKNFCMAGQWVMAGGGVPTVIASGRHAIQLLCHFEGKRFEKGNME